MKFKITIDVEMERTCYYDGRSFNDVVRETRSYLHEWIAESMSNGTTRPDNTDLITWMDNIEIVEE